MTNTAKSNFRPIAGRFVLRRVVRVFGLLLLMMSILFVFATFEREIDDFNAKARTFIVSGDFRLRQFDERGMPISFTARKPDGFQSPYYVVHYGLIYSDSMRRSSGSSSALWFHDPSIEYWDVPPPEKYMTLENFLAAADWVIENLETYRGQAHLLYDFDWSYPGLVGGKLESPWWSGLTDGYALLLLLRAADVTGKEKYLNAADRLYESVVTRVENGGSLLKLKNGTPWVEEYVVTGLPADKQPRVLNGMIYSYLGVRAYEMVKPAKSRNYAPKLLESIQLNLSEFDMGWWVAYDMLDNPTNLKYYEITLAQLKLLDQIATNSTFRETYVHWHDYRSWWVPLAAKWLFHGHFSFAALNIVLEILFLWMVIALICRKVVLQR